MRNFVIFTSLQIFLGDHIKENEMACVHRIHAKRNAYKVLVGESDGKELSEDAGKDGRIVLKWIGQEDVDVSI
jgi:hypothetical protein